MSKFVSGLPILPTVTFSYIMVNHSTMFWFGFVCCVNLAHFIFFAIVCGLGLCMNLAIFGLFIHYD